MRSFTVKSEVVCSAGKYSPAISKMLVFDSEVLLCTVDSSQFLGISAGCGANEVLVTKTHNTVTLYEVAPQKPTADFTTWRGRTLACSVIYSSKQKRYVSVLKNLSLQVWTQDETIISKGKNIMVPFEVDSLWSLHDSDPLIVFKNGAICQLDDSNTFRYVVEKTDAVVSLVCVRQSGNQTRVAYVSTSRQKGMKCHYIVFINDDTSQTVKHFVSCLPNGVSAPKGLCLPDLPGFEMEITVLGHDGLLVSGKRSISNNKIEWKTNFKMDNFENVELMTVAFHKGHFVLVQQNSLGVIDCVALSLKYQLQIHKRSVTIAEKTEKLKLYEVGDRLFLQAGRQIFFLPFRRKPAKLAQFIGCKMNEHNSNTVGSLSRNIRWASNGLIMEEELSTTVGNTSKGDATVSSDFLQIIFRYEQSRISEHVFCVQIFSELIEDKKLLLIGEALNYYEVVPEAVLVDILSSYTRCEDDRSHILCSYKNKKNFKALGSHPLIEQVVSMPMNDVFLQDELRKLTADQAIFLLRYLHRLLKFVNFVQEKNWTKIIQWVGWISALLDAHFHHVTVFKNKQVHDFLHEVMATAAVQCEFLENLAALQELVWIAKCKSSDVDNWRNASYSIESLVI